MRDALSLTLSVMLFCLLIFSPLLSENAALPPAPGRAAAWWGLLCPHLLGEPAQDGGGVTFTWPLLRYMLRFFRLNA